MIPWIVLVPPVAWVSNFACGFFPSSIPIAWARAREVHPADEISIRLACLSQIEIVRDSSGLLELYRFFSSSPSGSEEQLSIPSCQVSIKYPITFYVSESSCLGASIVVLTGVALCLR